MSGQEAVTSVTMTAGAALAVERFVKLTTAGRVIQGAAATDDVVGVSLSAAAAAGDVITMAMPGCKVKITAGAAIDVSAAAVPLTSDATGRAVGVGGATERIHGYALESAGGAGEVITMLLVKGSDRRDA